MFQSNETVKANGVHIINLLTLAAFISTLYVFHCVEKNGALKSYSQHVFSVIGIFGTLIWMIFGDMVEYN